MHDRLRSPAVSPMAWRERPRTVPRRGPRRLLAAALAGGALTLALGGASASAAVDTPYYMNNSTPAYTGHCYTGYGPSSYKDLLPSPPTMAGTYAGQTLFGCSPPSPGETVGPGRITVDAWFTNTGKKACTTPWFLLHNSSPTRAGELIAGANYNGVPAFTVPANTRTPTHFQVNATVDSATTLYPGDQLMAMYDVRTQSGPCSQMTLYYGSATTPTGVTVPMG